MSFAIRRSPYEQVHATITYYLANQEKLESYLALVRRRQEEAWQEQQRHPSEFVRALRERLERRRIQGERKPYVTGEPLSVAT